MKTARISAIVCIILGLVLAGGCGDRAEEIERAPEGDVPASAEEDRDAVAAADSVQTATSREFTTWMGEWETWSSAMTESHEDGWLVFCEEPVPRQYSFGVVYRLSGAGDILWEKEFYGRSLEPSDIIATSDGNYVLAGSDSPTWEDEEFDDMELAVEVPEGETAEAEISTDIWVCKTDPRGEELWNRSYGYTGDNFCSGVVECPEGGLALAGTSFTMDDRILFRLIRTDPDGEVLWDSTYGYPEGQLCEVVFCTADGNFLLGGNITGYTEEPEVIVLAMANEDGHLIWMERFGRHFNDQVHSLAETPEGDFLAAGSRQGPEGTDQAYIMKFSASGEEIWTVYYEVEEFQHVNVTANGNLLACGNDIIVHTNSSGEVMQTVKLPGDFRSCRADEVRLLEENRVVVLGHAYPPEDAVTGGADGPLAFLTVLDI
ncbi:MAG: hypothetical protein GF388_06130 [Candidatus Aegiribacteria sp.]|nr:hypothetical protein [Candidatus Aegiribacteria sp.]MBD3294751.1 hypothetical protein [Candidatus Fermentibacteria bacterium]